MKPAHYAIALLAGSSALTLATFAQAQTDTSATEVVVTGSRVIKNGNNSPTPLTVVPIDDALRLQPTNVADALNDLPVFAGSRNQYGNPSGGTGSNVGGGNSGGNNLNLRNMGSQRTLILFDNHRVSPTNEAGIVDVDMIPQMMLQRVDVVTGGASAVYGSDAVTGVVNFVTDKNFNGIKANAQYGVTQLGDNRGEAFGIAAGTGLFGGRGHIEGSYEYHNNDGVLFQSSRDPTHKAWTVQGTGTAAIPYYLTPYARVSNSTFGGLVTAAGCACNGQTFDQNGVLSPFAHGTPAGAANLEIGGDGVYFDDLLSSPYRSHQLFGRLDYEFTDKIHGYAEVSGTDKLGSNYGSWFNLNNVTLSSSDGFLASSYQAQLAAAKQSTFKLNKNAMDVGRTHPVNDEQEVFVNAGLDGDLGNGYKWDIGFVHSTAKLTLTNTTAVNNGRLAASLDAVTDPSSGQVVCNVSITNPGLYPGCVPLNPFGPTSDNPAAIAYIRGQTQYVANTTMDDIGGSFSGAPFSTWAGPVNSAVSGEWRRLAFNGAGNALPTNLLSCVGLRYNCGATTTTWANTIANRSTVSQTVSEGAFETDIPVLKDAPLVQSLNLNGAVRYTSYSTSGSYWTWKAGVDWHVNDEIRLRGTRSRDIRAPTLDDLYAPASSGPTNYPDQLTNSTAATIQIGGGNPNLRAETGDTWSGGVVLRPKFIPGFSLSLDYFNIDVSNAITPLLAINTTYQRACYASGGSSPFCQIQVRPLGFTNTTLANQPTAVKNLTINISDQVTNGMDIEANYATRVLDRPFSMRVLTTYQPHIQFVNPGLVTIDQGGVAFGTNTVQASAVWRLTAFFHYSPFDNFNIDLQTRWRSNLKLDAVPTDVVSSSPIPAVSFTNLNLAYILKSSLGQSELFLNISDLFDTKPPPAGYTGGQTIPGQQTGFAIGDDPLGRAFTFGVRFRR